MQPESKTLIILSPGFPENEEDTTCLPAQQLFVRHLQQNFPEIRIIVLSFQYPFKETTYQWNGVTVISFNGRNRGGLKRLLLWKRVWVKLNALKKTNAVLGLFSFWCTECALVGDYYARMNSKLHFTWILGQDARQENKFVKIIRPNGNSLVAMSDFLANEFEKNHKVRPHHIISNGIDPADYSAYNGARTIDVLGAGSLIPLKQYDLFIELIAEVRKENPGIKAVICGKGPEENSLTGLINRYKLQKNISLAGEVSHAEVLRLMQRSKIFLHPSSYEGFSTVCLEALYAGVHVISFCKPLHKTIPHWHIVNSRHEMLDTLNGLLANHTVSHEAVMPFSMKDSAKSVMKLFGM
ncbi:MAG TPA: glycosyltransferase family 4 protein [Chitinophagaceae bacterium]